MSTFWRAERDRLIAEHRDAGHLLGGGPGLDPDHLDDWFWRVQDKAAEEGRTHGADEFAEEVHQVALRFRDWQAKKYVAGVLARHRAEVAAREALRIRQGKLRLAMALREMDRPKIAA